MSSFTADLRKGGHYRIEGSHIEGAAYSITGTYIDLVEGQRVEMSWEYDGPVASSKGSRSVVLAEFDSIDEHHTEPTLTHERHGGREAAEVRASPGRPASAS